MTRFKLLVAALIACGLLVSYAFYLRSTKDRRGAPAPTAAPSLDPRFLEAAREKPEDPPPPPPPPRVERRPLRYEDLVPPPPAPPPPKDRAERDGLEALERARDLTAVRRDAPAAARAASATPAVRRLARRTVTAGTLIEAQLDQPLRTDQPATIVAHSLRPVYDFHGRSIVLPAGTRFLGSIGASQAFDAAAELHWHRLITPDGRSLVLGEAASTTDDDGGAVDGRRRTHKAQKAGAILVSALTSAAVEAARGGGDTVNVGSAAGAEAVSGTEALVSRWAQRALSRPPTLHLEAGTRILIRVNADVSL